MSGYTRRGTAIPAGPPHQEPNTVMRRTLTFVLLTGLLAWTGLAATGCAKRHRIEFVSNTCYIWSVDGQGSTVSNDCGTASYRVAGDVHCVRATNITDTGYVRVRIDGGAWAETTAPRGSVETCR